MRFVPKAVNSACCISFSVCNWNPFFFVSLLLFFLLFVFRVSALSLLYNSHSMIVCEKTKQNMKLDSYI